MDDAADGCRRSNRKIAQAKIKDAKTADWSRKRKQSQQAIREAIQKRRREGRDFRRRRVQESEGEPERPGGRLQDDDLDADHDETSDSDDSDYDEADHSRESPEAADGSDELERDERVAFGEQMRELNPRLSNFSSYQHTEHRQETFGINLQGDDAASEVASAPRRGQLTWMSPWTARADPRASTYKSKSYHPKD